MSMRPMALSVKRAFSIIRLPCEKLVRLPIRNEKGDITRIMAMVIDVTESVVFFVLGLTRFFQQTMGQLGDKEFLTFYVLLDGIFREESVYFFLR